MPTETVIKLSVGSHLRQGERSKLLVAIGHHLREVGNIPRVVLPRELLQPKCAGLRHSRLMGSPPSEVGVTWSALNESGVLCGASYWMGPLLPRHSQHWALVRLHSALNAACSRRHGLPLAGMLSPAYSPNAVPCPCSRCASLRASGSSSLMHAVHVALSLCSSSMRSACAPVSAFSSSCTAPIARMVRAVLSCARALRPSVTVSP